MCDGVWQGAQVAGQPDPACGQAAGVGRHALRQRWGPWPQARAPHGEPGTPGCQAIPPNTPPSSPFALPGGRKHCARHERARLHLRSGVRDRVEREVAEAVHVVDVAPEHLRPPARPASEAGNAVRWSSAAACAHQAAQHERMAAWVYTLRALFPGCEHPHGQLVKKRQRSTDFGAPAPARMPSSPVASVPARTQDMLRTSSGMPAAL